MNQRNGTRWSVAALLLSVNGWTLWVSSTGMHSTSHIVLQAGGCSVPVTVMRNVPGSNVYMVVLHGLGANRRVMYPLSRSLAASDVSAVFVLDLPGHGDNTDPFSFERVETCAAAVIEALDRNKEIQLHRTVLFGHSMGGALAVRLADYFPTAATVAISPAPMVRVASFPSGLAIPLQAPRRMPNNLLIFTGQFDLPFMEPAADKFVEMAGGERHDAEDFRQRRAVQWVKVPYATHTSLIYDLSVWKTSDDWWRLAMPLAVPDHAFFARWIFVFSVPGMLGILLACSFSARWLTQAFPSASASLACGPLPRGKVILLWVCSGMFSVSLLNFFVPLRFLRMYNGDYLASCLLLAGIVLCALLCTTQSKSSGVPGLRSPRLRSGQAGQVKPPPPWRAMAAGAVMGMAAMLAFGAWMNGTLTDTWLNSARWLRFPVILLACLPYAFAEEWALGTPGAGNWLAQIRRYLLFGILRLLIWLSILFALYVYASQQILLAVLLFYMGFFSLLVRLGADAVGRRTASPAGAAVFTAILMAWFIAAVFPIS